MTRFDCASLLAGRTDWFTARDLVENEVDLRGLSERLDRLARQGHLQREVRSHWEKQRGHAASMFGGAGVVKRRRAYYKVQEKTS